MLTRSIFYHDAKLPVCKNVQMTVFTQIWIHSVYMHSRSGRTKARLLLPPGDQKPIPKPPIYMHKADNFNIKTCHYTLHCTEGVL